METLPRLRSGDFVVALSALILSACDQGRGKAPTAVVDDASLQAQVDDLQGKVAAIRGRSFRKPVVATWVPRAHISDLQDSLSRALGYSADTAGTGSMDEVFHALGYIDSTESVVGATGNFLDQNVAAFYVKGTNHVWVVSDQQNSSELNATIAHELVHALQDQNFGDSLAGSAELDEQVAFQFLEEGEAEYVADLWLWGASTTDLWEASPGYTNFTPTRFAAWLKGSTAYKDERPVISWPSLAPYTCGVTFVDKVRANSGWLGVDTLHKNHPRATSQAFNAGTTAGLHRSFLDWSSTYAFPSMADRKSDDQGRLGELYLDALMATWGSPLVTQWNGDRFWVWGAGAGRGTAVAGRTAWVSGGPAYSFLDNWGRGMDDIVGGRTTGAATDSIEFRASDSIHFARGVARGAEVLVVWGDLRKRKLDSLWSDLSGVPSAGSLARSMGEVGGSANGSKWKGPWRSSPFQR